MYSIFRGEQSDLQKKTWASSKAIRVIRACYDNLRNYQTVPLFKHKEKYNWLENEVPPISLTDDSKTQLEMSALTRLALNRKTEQGDHFFLEASVRDYNEMCGFLRFNLHLKPVH